MAYRITGRVFAISQTRSSQSKSGNSYTMRDLVITIRKFDPYTGQPSDDTGNTPKFTFMNDRCQQLDNIKVGDIVIVHFDISGREYQKDGRTEYITDIRPFRVELLTNTIYQQSHNAQPQAAPMTTQQTSACQQPYPQQQSFYQPQTAQMNAYKDDMPF